MSTLKARSRPVVLMLTVARSMASNVPNADTDCSMGRRAASAVVTWTGGFTGRFPAVERSPQAAKTSRQRQATARSGLVSADIVLRFGIWLPATCLIGTGGLVRPVLTAQESADSWQPRLGGPALDPVETAEAAT